MSLNAQAAAVPPVLLDFADLKRLGITFSRPYLRELEAAGKFPRRLSLGGRKVQWVYAEVMSFVARRVAERDTSAAERSDAVRTAVRAAVLARHGVEAG